MPALDLNRKIVVNCSAEQLYEKLRDFKQWPEWSPWIACEPDCKLSFAEDGTSYSWEGEMIGSGEMSVQSEVTNREIIYELTFFKPWKSKSEVRFELIDHEDGTELKWIMKGGLPFFMFWMKSMMKAHIGSDYERGLLMLKELIELGEVPSKLDFIGYEFFEGGAYVGVRTTCSTEEVSDKMEADFTKLSRYTEDQELELTGAPYTVYHKWDPVGKKCEYTIGFPVEEAPEAVPVGFMTGVMPAGNVYSIQHTGPYRHLPNAWAAAHIRVNAKVFKPTKRCPPFETYENDPNEVADFDIVTKVRFPVD